MKQLWLQRLTSFDRKLVLLLAVLVLVSFAIPLRQEAGARLLVSSGEKTIFVAPLDRAQLVELAGPLGMTQFEIKQGGVRVLSSPCPNKVCIGLGEARHSGDLLACVPNRLVFRIEGATVTEEQSYDLLSR